MIAPKISKEKQSKLKEIITSLSNVILKTVRIYGLG